MNLDRARAARRYAIYHANTHGFSYLAEDFGSYCVVTYLGTGFSSVKYLWPGFLRQELGNKATLEGRAQIEARRTMSQVTEDQDPEGRSVQVGWVDPGTDEHDLTRVADDMALQGTERFVFMLAHKWGMDRAEIGETLGISRTTAWRHCREVNKRIKAELFPEIGTNEREKNGE